MGQGAGQFDRIIHLQHRIRQVTPRWFRRHVTMMRRDGRISRQSAQQMEQADAERAPELLAQLRDDEVLVLIRQRRPEALGAFYDRYGGLVFSIALRITGAQLGAELVTQDVFQIVWHSAYTFSGQPGLVSDWLVRLSCDRALAARGARLPQSHTPGASLVGGPTAPHAAATQHEPSFREDVRAAIAALPVDQRRALELACYGGLTTPEIGVVLGTADGAVRAHLCRGLTSVRDALQASTQSSEERR